jgi:hypothetical protein
MCRGTSYHRKRGLEDQITNLQPAERDQTVNTNNDMRLSQQWATRPNDQRFLTLDELGAYVNARQCVSRETITNEINVVLESEDLRLQNALTGHCVDLTHWSFGQLARLAGAPAEYLRTLPPVLAAPALQWSLERRAERGEQIKVLTTRAYDRVECRALTSPTYGRIWDTEVVQALRRLGPEWHVPAASYSGADPLRATTLYASDRDIFVFLCRDEEIDIGGGQTLHRGIMTWNSETGAATFGLATFTYDRVCDNRIIWGAANQQELRIRHTSGAPDRLVREAQPMIDTYAASGAKEIAATVETARRLEVGKDKDSVLEWMNKRGFTRSQARAAYEFAERDSHHQGLNPRSIWGLVQGATDYTHDIKHTDARTEIERAAGALLDNLAA